MTELWLRLGGRGIDTAADYGGHQAHVGAAVREALAAGVVSNRSQLFVTSKISPESLAVGESSVILLHPPAPLVGVSIGMERGCQYNDSLADG